jgi:hypothetical protein
MHASPPEPLTMVPSSGKRPVSEMLKGAREAPPAILDQARCSCASFTTRGPTLDY